MLFKKKKVVQLHVALKYNAKYSEFRCSSEKFNIELDSMIESILSYYTNPIFVGLQINSIDIELQYRVDAYNNKVYYSDFKCIIPKHFKKIWGL